MMRISGALAVVTLLLPLTAVAASSAEVAAGGVASAAGKRPMCKGERATIVGTRDRDHLVGTRGADVIVAKGGHDGIFAGGGRDRICGGRGNDLIDGGKRRDRQFGQKGRDHCAGEDGEHRFHFSCEVHAPSLTNPPEPPAAPRAAAAEELSQLAPRTTSRVGDDWFRYTDPFCGTTYVTGSGSGAINFGHVSFRGAYTDPAYVYLQSHHWYWNPFTGQFSAAPPAEEFGQVISLPGDGNHYSYSWGLHLLSGSWPTYSVHAHAVYWWTGTQWTDPRVYYIDQYSSANSSVMATRCISGAQ